MGAERGRPCSADGYVFHGPGGDLDFDALRAYFAALRAAFSDLRIVREQIIVDGRFLAARNTFAGNFTSVFTSSPIGPIEPTGQHVEWEVINLTWLMFRGSQLAHRADLLLLGVQ